MSEQWAFAESKSALLSFSGASPCWTRTSLICAIVLSSSEESVSRDPAPPEATPAVSAPKVSAASTDGSEEPPACAGEQPHRFPE